MATAVSYFDSIAPGGTFIPLGDSGTIYVKPLTIADPVLMPAPPVNAPLEEVPATVPTTPAPSSPAAFAKANPLVILALAAGAAYYLTRKKRR